MNEIGQQAGGPAAAKAPGPYSVILFEGEDAVGFLQGQLTLDVQRLEPGSARMTACTTPKGRVRALLRLCRDGGRLVAALPSALAEPLARSLALYVLRAKVRIATPGWRVEALREPPADGGLVIPPVATGAPWLRVAEAGTEAPSAGAMAAVEWERAEILAGIPEIGPATAEQFLPQMLDLDRLGGVSYSKGCYVGQEIVARAHHLGQVKRGLALYRCPAGRQPAPGDSLLEGGRAAGTVLRAAAGDGDTLILAVTRSEGVPALVLGDAARTPLEPVRTDWAAATPTPASGGGTAERP